MTLVRVFVKLGGEFVSIKVHFSKLNFFESGIKLNTLR